MEKFDINRIDAHTLKVFLDVLASGSVSKTANNFLLNQSTVSHTLEKLRYAVGQVLFVRAGRGIAPTEAAIALAPHAREVVSKLEALVYLEKFQPEQDDRTITVASNVCELLPELIELSRLLKKLVPNARIRLLELGSRENLEITLENGIADLAISVHNNGRSPLLASRMVAEDPVKVFYDGKCRPPIRTIDDYFDAEHAALDFGGTRKSNVAKILAKHGRKRKMKIGVANVYALAAVIEGSELVATMQERLKFSAFSNLDYFTPPFIDKTIRFDIIWHRRHQHDARNIWLRELIRSLFKQVNLRNTE